LALYRINESSVWNDLDMVCESYLLFENNDDQPPKTFDDLYKRAKKNQALGKHKDIDELYASAKKAGEKLNNTIKKLEDNSKKIREEIDNHSKSWLEKKLESFKAAIERFEVKYKLTDDNKSKTLIKKILSILTRIVKYINEKLLQLTRWGRQKFSNN
jgi:hypothetical protein